MCIHSCILNLFSRTYFETISKLYSPCFTAVHLVFAMLGPATVSIQGLQDTGNGFIWTDQEMADFFPALAQMPLGDMALGGP